MAAQPWTLAIDFGTSFTVAVARLAGRHPEVIEIAGERRVPSLILAEDADHIIVGRVAEELSATHPHSTLRAPKSRLGDQAPVVLAGRPYQVVQLVSALLAHIYEEAVRQLGSPPTQVRLTHPATWNRPWLNRLLEAAAKAGLPDPVLVPEPVAAALSYASEVGVPVGQRVLVYDLGGGTFDTAVVEATETGFEVVGRPGGDRAIGGELFDEMLANEIGSRLDPASWESVQVAADPSWQRVAASLRNESRRAKETLSAHPYADVLLPLPTGMAQQRVMQDEYEELIRPYVEETVTLLARCLSNAGLTAQDVVAIYLVGGASRAPIVERLTAAAFPGVPVSRRGDPKVAVALGAALAADPAQPVSDAEGPHTTEDAAAPTSPQGLLLAPPPATGTSLPEQRVGTVPRPNVPPPRAAPAPHAPAAAPPPQPAPAAPATVAAATATAAARHPVPTAPPPTAQRSSTKRGVLIAVILSVALITLIVGLMVVLSGGGDDGDGAAAPSTVATSVVRAATEETVAPLTQEELAAKLLTVGEVNDVVGAGFLETPPGELTDPICGLTAIPTQVSALRLFDNATTGARVASAIDRYPTISAARAAFDQEKSLATTCLDRTYEIDGYPYTVVILPFDDALASLPSSVDREYVGLLVGYSLAGDASTTTQGLQAAAPANTIYQFVVESIDGPNIIGTSFITVDRELTQDEIGGYIQLFQVALSRAEG